MNKKEITLTINAQEAELLEAVLFTARANGNTLKPLPFDPTPQEWRMICHILLKLHNEMK